MNFIAFNVNGLIPKSLEIRPLIKTHKGLKIAYKSSCLFLGEWIQVLNRKKHEVIQKIVTTEEDLRKIISIEDYHKVKDICKKGADYVFEKTKANHIMKFDEAINRY